MKKNKASKPPQPQTLIEKFNAIQAVGCSVEIPWTVRWLFGTPGTTIDVMGDQISLGEDYGSLEQVQEAIEFFAVQLGGKVTWISK